MTGSTGHPKQKGLEFFSLRRMLSTVRSMFVRALKRRVLVETAILTILCAVDTYWTLILVRLGIGHETNPLLAHSLEVSNWAFLGLKLGSFLIPITILEALRETHPRLILKAMRYGMFGYIAVYLVGSLGVHGLI